MSLVNLLIGCIGLMLAGSALTRFAQTRKSQLAFIALIEILTGGYFVVAAIGQV